MDGPGFHVGIATLDEASAGIKETIDDQKRLELSRLPGPSEMYGDDDLRGALKDYGQPGPHGLKVVAELAVWSGTGDGA